MSFEAKINTLYENAMQIEAALIGAIVQGGNIHSVLAIVKDEFFCSQENFTVWKAIKNMVETGRTPTAKNLEDELKGHELFKDSQALLKHCNGDMVRGIPHYIKTTATNLAKNSARITLAEECFKTLEIIDSSQSENPIEKLVYNFRGKLDDINSESGFPENSIVQVSNKVLEDIANPPKITKTGLKSYDWVLGGGFMAGESYTLAGSNKAGKTMLAGQLSYLLNQRGSKHAYLCLEMGSKQITQRQIALHCGFPVSKFWHENTRTSKYLADDIIKFQGDIMRNNNTIFVDCPLLRASDAKAMLYRMKMNGCDGVIIDYFSLISPDIGFKGTTNEHQDDLAQELTKIAKDIGIWIVYIAQMNNNGSTYGSSALLRASTHIAEIKKCDDTCGKADRYFSTISARLVPSRDLGDEQSPGFTIHENGSHMIENVIIADKAEYQGER